MQLFLLPLLVFHAFQLVLFYLFGEAVIAVDMFLNVATTNVSEAGELLDNLWPAIVAVCLLYIPTIAIAVITCKRKIQLPASYRKKRLLSAEFYCFFLSVSRLLPGIKIPDTSPSAKTFIPPT